MGLLTQPDATLYRGFFKEMSKLRGIHVQYRYPIKISSTIHAEMNTKLSDPIEMDIIFQENPSVRTLKSIGWVSEIGDDKPYVAQLPFDTPELQVESVITIPPFYEINSRSRDFKITSITTLLEFPDCLTCTLAPIFDTKFINKDYDTSNYNYLDNKDTPASDSPNNKIDNGYNYLNIT